jgi:hypothetical protein
MARVIPITLSSLKIELEEHETAATGGGYSLDRMMGTGKESGIAIIGSGVAELCRLRPFHYGWDTVSYPNTTALNGCENLHPDLHPCAPCPGATGNLECDLLLPTPWLLHTKDGRYEWVITYDKPRTARRLMKQAFRPIQPVTRSRGKPRDSR